MDVSANRLSSPARHRNNSRDKTHCHQGQLLVPGRQVHLIPCHWSQLFLQPETTFVKEFSGCPTHATQKTDCLVGCLRLNYSFCHGLFFDTRDPGFCSICSVHFFKAPCLLPSLMFKLIGIYGSVCAFPWPMQDKLKMCICSGGA